MPVATIPPNTYELIFNEREEDLFDSEVDWREDLDGVAPGDAQFSTEGANHAVLHGVIPYNKLRSFILYAVGHAAAENQAPWRLFRINPPTHPLYPWMRVRSVTIRGFKPRVEKDAVIAEPYPPSEVVPWFPYQADVNLPGTQDQTAVTEFEERGTVYEHPTPTLPVRQYSMRPRRGGEAFGSTVAVADDRAYFPFCYRTVRYEEAKVTVEFAHPQWGTLEDSDFYFNGDEVNRNVYWTTEPSLDVVALEGGQGNSLFWREGKTTAGAPGGTVPNRATNIPTANSVAVEPPTSGFKAPQGILQPRSLLVANWMHVPERFIFDENLTPTKMLPLLGTTNASTWRGYAPGVALLVAVSFQPVSWPIYGINAPVIRLWNVRYSFKIQDLPRRPDAELTPNPAGSGKRGWKLFSAADGFAYYATRFNDKDLYEESDFDKLFEHREA